MIIDLSVPLDENTPVYPGDPKTSVQKAGDLEKDGYYDSFVSMGTHNGTHVDAPIHMVAGGGRLGDIKVDQFVGRGRYIKVVGSKYDFESVKNVNVQADDIVIFHTGMSDKYHDSAYYDDYPALTEDIARYLVDQKVKMVGVDTCSVDHEPFEVHRILLGGGVLIIENLTNLDQLAGKQFRVFALPIKLQEDGAPARVIAETIE